MSRKQTRNLIRIVAAAVLTVAAWLIPLDGWWKVLLFLVPYFVVGYDVIFGAFRKIFHGELFDEQFLMTVATAGAFALGKGLEGVAVMLLYQVGELFQSLAVGKSRRSIAALMDIRPDTATVLREGKEMTVSPEEVAKGETIVVRPGEKIPLDGIVLSGSSAINTCALTGESRPVDVTVGDRVVSGSVNLSGLLSIRTENVFAESTVSKILDLVENASSRKSHTENFISRFAKYYTPCVVIGAVLLALIPSLITGDVREWVGRALTFLVISCPCALVISVPLSFFGGIGGASRKGILVKGAEYIETLSKVRGMVFDKTGTLTKGNFEVVAVHPDHVTEAELLDLAAAAECHSTHPIAESIVLAHGGHIDLDRIGETEELSGLGVCATVDGHQICVGNPRLMEKIGAKAHDCHKVGTVIHIAKDGVYLGHIVISDTIKPGAADALRMLKQLGVDKTVMLTGDRREIGEAVAAEVGVNEVQAELMPADKVKAVEALLSDKSGRKYAFVGDGINDAPVLSRADVGIAMGAMGSDAAIEAADVVLMDDDPRKIADAIYISEKTMRIAKQNILFALLVKGVTLLLGALGVANMWYAIFADVGVTVLAVLNAMRTMHVKDYSMKKK